VFEDSGLFPKMVWYRGRDKDKSQLSDYLVKLGID